MEEGDPVGTFARSRVWRIIAPDGDAGTLRLPPHNSLSVNDILVSRGWHWRGVPEVVPDSHCSGSIQSPLSRESLANSLRIVHIFKRTLLIVHRANQLSDDPRLGKLLAYLVLADLVAHHHMPGVKTDAIPPSKRKTVAVIGGSFDPPTLAHLMVASQVVQLGCADEAWVVPCGNRPDKDTQVDAKTRLRMTQAAIEAVIPEEFPVKCCDIEVANGSFIPTVFLMRRLREGHPDIAFRFVIGTDLPPTLPNWDHGDELIAENEFIVLPRPDSKPESEWPKGLKYVRVTDRVTVDRPLLTTDISSTAARNRLRELGWLGAASIVPKQVLQIIRDEGLYGVDSFTSSR